jgi:hypothetical protein
VVAALELYVDLDATRRLRASVTGAAVTDHANDVAVQLDR